MAFCNQNYFCPPMASTAFWPSFPCQFTFEAPEIMPGFVPLQWNGPWNSGNQVTPYFMTSGGPQIELESMLPHGDPGSGEKLLVGSQQSGNFGYPLCPQMNSSHFPFPLIPRGDPSFPCLPFQGPLPWPSPHNSAYPMSPEHAQMVANGQKLRKLPDRITRPVGRPRKKAPGKQGEVLANSAPFSYPGLFPGPGGLPFPCWQFEGPCPLPFEPSGGQNILIVPENAPLRPNDPGIETVPATTGHLLVPRRYRKPRKEETPEGKTSHEENPPAEAINPEETLDVDCEHQEKAEIKKAAEKETSPEQDSSTIGDLQEEGAEEDSGQEESTTPSAPGDSPVYLGTFKKTHKKKQKILGSRCPVVRPGKVAVPKIPRSWRHRRNIQCIKCKFHGVENINSWLGKSNEDRICPFKACPCIECQRIDEMRRQRNGKG